MNKLLTVGAALMLLSTSAFASKARLMALGEDKDGSYFLSDYRNIYINPSELNSLGNLAVLEYGASGNAFGGGLTLDTDGKPKAQGGVLYGLSNGMKFGVVLGDETDVAALTRALSSNGAGAFLQTADNVVDVFVGGSASVNWGANLIYTNTKSEVTGSRYNQHSYATRLGVNSGAWNAHLLLALGAKADSPDQASTPTYKGKFGMRVGGGYDLSPEGKAFLMYENYSWKQDNASSLERVGSFHKWFVGYGHQKKVSDAGTLIAKAQVEMTSIKLDAVTGIAQAKIDRFAIPLTFGYEHAALEWLTLSGSVVQNLFGTVKDEGLTDNFTTNGGSTGATIRALAAARYGSSSSGTGGKKTINNSTSVNAGATLTFGKLSVDGLVAATGAARNSGALNNTANTNAGVLSLDNLETRVALTYKF